MPLRRPDRNGDRIPDVVVGEDDIVVSEDCGFSVSVLLGKGGGTFRRQPHVPVIRTVDCLEFV